MITLSYNKTDIEKEFEQNNTELMMTVYKDGKAQILTMQNTDVIAFNLWSYLTKAEPKFDEIRIRVATDEEIKEWHKDTPFDCAWSEPND